MATKGKQKNDHNPEAGVVGSLATLLSETSHDDVDTVGEGPGKGSRLLPSPRAPLVTRPSPPSRQDPGVGDISRGDGPSYSRAWGRARLQALFTSSQAA